MPAAALKPKKKTPGKASKPEKKKQISKPKSAAKPASALPKPAVKPAAVTRAPRAAKTPAASLRKPAAKPGGLIAKKEEKEKDTSVAPKPKSGPVVSPPKPPEKPGTQATVSSEVVSINSNTFSPSETVKAEIEAQGKKGLDVRVVIPEVTSEGIVKIVADKNDNYSSAGMGYMFLNNEWTSKIGGMYVNFSVSKNAITGGYASLTKGGGNTNDWLKEIQKNSALLGGLGLNVGNIPQPVNQLDNGKVKLGVKNLNVEIGGFLGAKLDIALENNKNPDINADAKINIKGIAEGNLTLKHQKDKLTGEVSLGINFKSFSGLAKVKYNPDGTVDIGGKAGYTGDKLSGEVEFVATDLDTANKFAKDSIKAAGGKENVQKAAAPAPVPAPKKGKKKRALAATGQLGFNLTNWFAGTVNVVVDGKGDVTVIGKIAPPAEIELLKQKNWEKQLIKFEAKAYYGIPMVGNLNLFANIALYALAKLGPAKLYKIEVLGTYSTDPTVQKSIQISGSLNISAYAGLRLRAEGGAGIELIGHELKFGVGLNADVGVKAYADARPTIGYRDPGVFFISGTLEIVAQPMLGLGGDFFIELDSPFWSPAPDKKWIWPLFSKEWPLTDPIGLNAVLKDYELGSGKYPEVELKKPKFDPSKFMTNMVDDKLPEKTGKKGKGQAKFKEDGSVKKPGVKPKKPAPKKADKLPPKGKSPKKGKSAKPDPKAAAQQKNMKVFADAAKLLGPLKGKGPLSRVELNKELDKIKGRVKGVTFTVQPKGQMWTVIPKAGGRSGKKFEFGRTSKVKGQSVKDGEVGETKKIVAKGKSHKLWVKVTGKKATVMIASDPTPLDRFLESKAVEDLKKKDPEGHVNGAKRLLKETNIDATAVLNAIAGSKPEVAEKKDQETEKNMQEMVKHLKWIFEQLGGSKADLAKINKTRKLAFDAVNKEFKQKQSFAETNKIIERIEKRLKASGVKDLEITPQSSKGKFTLYVTASDKFPLGNFTRRLSGTVSPKGRTVKSAIRLTLIDDQPEETAEIPKADSRAQVPIGGEVLRRNKNQSKREVDAYTWNTSGIDSPNNDSHAERQFIDWLEKRPDIMKRIEKIEIRNFSRSPCSICSDDLSNLLKTIRKIQEKENQSIFLNEAHIYWTTHHHSAATYTSWQNIQSLRSAGWILHAPLKGFPPKNLDNIGTSGMLEWEADPNVPQTLK